VALTLAGTGTMVRIIERKGEGTSGIQPAPELVQEFQHI
jgi:hypothetical protein